MYSMCTLVCWYAGMRYICEFVLFGSKLCGRMQNSLQRRLTGNPSCPHVGGAPTQGQDGVSLRAAHRFKSNKHYVLH